MKINCDICGFDMFKISADKDYLTMSCGSCDADQMRFKNDNYLRYTHQPSRQEKAILKLAECVDAVEDGTNPLRRSRVKLIREILNIGDNDD